MLLKADESFELTKANARNFKQLLGPAWNLLQLFSLGKKVSPDNKTFKNLTWNGLKATLLQSGTDETICIVVTVIHPSSTGALGEGQKQKNKLVATPTAYLPQAIAVSQI